MSRLKAFQLSQIIWDDESYHFSDAGTGGRYTFTETEYGPSVRADKSWRTAGLVSTIAGFSCTDIYQRRRTYTYRKLNLRAKDKKTETIYIYFFSAQL